MASVANEQKKGPAPGLRARAWFSLGALVVVMAVLLFLTAGTVRYWEAWVFLLIFTAASALTTIDLLRRDPALLERRMRGGPTAEKRPTQRVIMVFASLGFIGLLVVPGLDRRFHWSSVPASLVIAGDIVMAIGFYLIARVYRANTYTSATVEVTEGQKVISTGPYAVVRHPMYASALLYLLAIPIALGSYWGLLAFVLMLPVLIWRLLDEEKLLARELEGYTEYQRRVRYRLVPFIW